MQLIVPAESTGRKLDCVRLLHPHTGNPAKFLLDKSTDAPHSLLELTKVGTDARSALIDDQITSDGSLVVATPLHPLFLIIGVLFTHRNKPLPLDTLLELSSNDNTESIPEEIIAAHIPSVCNSESPFMCQLDMDKLKTFLDARVGRVRAGLPPLIRTEIIKSVEPVDPNQQVSTELAEAAEIYAAVSMLTSSWLSPELGSWLLSSYDFSVLEKAAQEIHGQQQILQSMDYSNLPMKGKRISSTDSKNGKQPPAKRAKPEPKNNTSILDMFKKK